MHAPAPKPIRPFKAARALRRLIADPEDTSQFALVLEALEGSGPRRLYRRMQRSSSGRDVLRRRPDVLARLRDRAWLAALPPQTVGHQYLAWAEAEGRSGDALKEVVERGRNAARGGEREPHFVESYQRDTHDLYHLVTGWGTDLLGELGVLSFTVAQTRNIGILIPVLYGGWTLRRARPEALRLAIAGLRQGLRARLLAAQDWVWLLQQPVGHAQRLLRIDPAPKYEPLYAGR